MRSLGRSLSAGPFITLAFVSLAAWALTATRDYAVPIALALLTWFLINGLADALRRLPVLGPRIPRVAAQVAASVTFFCLILLAARIVVGNLADLAGSLADRESPLIASARALSARFGLDGLVTREVVMERLAIEDLITGSLNVARGFLSDIALVFLYTLFLLIDERFYDAKLRALAPDPARRARLRATLAEISGETRVYLWLMTLVSAGVGAVTWLACWAAGVEGAAFWGFLAFGLNYIPTIGSILAVLLPAGFALLTLDDPAVLIVLLAGLGAIQFLAGEIVVPRIMGTSLNLSSFVILLTLVAWGAMWGPAGMFLAIPITVIAVMVFARFDSTRPIAILLSKTGRLPDPAPDLYDGADERRAAPPPRKPARLRS